MKWALLKASDIGPMGRGQNGKKKAYEIVVDGRVVFYSWGMAEKFPHRTARCVFPTEQAAIAAAYARLDSKTAKGYEIAYAVS